MGKLQLLRGVCLLVKGIPWMYKSFSKHMKPWCPEICSLLESNRKFDPLRVALRLNQRRCLVTLQWNSNSGLGILLVMCRTRELWAPRLGFITASMSSAGTCKPDW